MLSHATCSAHSEEKGLYPLECSSGNLRQLRTARCAERQAEAKKEEGGWIGWDEEEMFKDKSESWDAPLPLPAPAHADSRTYFPRV